MPMSLAALLIGGLFGAGLAISGMMNPAKVIGFLDFADSWDPTLAVVMAAALGTAAIGYRVVLGRHRPLLDKDFSIPRHGRVDRPLLFGAVLFGVGWGLAGFCPGPALSALSTTRTEVFVFVAAMIAGMLLYQLATSIAERAKSQDVGTL